MPDPVDPDDEDADPSVRPEKVEVPEVAFKPIVRFDFDIEAGHVRSGPLSPIKSKRACNEMPDPPHAAGLPAAASGNHEGGGGRGPAGRAG